MSKNNSASQVYEKSQLGWMVIALFAAVIGYVLFTAFITEYWLMMAPLAALFALVLLLFFRLTVRVDAGAVTCTYGIGIISKRIEFKEIRSAEAVKSPWYYGFGIRKIPAGWMYNIAGPHSVELTLESGRLFRVGTAEPKELIEQINARLKKE